MAYCSVAFSANAEVANAIDVGVRLYEESTQVAGIMTVEAWVSGSTSTITPVTDTLAVVAGGGQVINQYAGGHILAVCHSTGVLIVKNATRAGAKTRTLRVMHRGMVYGQQTLTYS